MQYRKNNSSRTIRVKYPGKCACCGALIKAGEIADYYPSRRDIAHVGGLDGNSPRCTAELTKQQDPGFVDLDRMYEDQCSEICSKARNIIESVCSRSAFHMLCPDALRS
jgi:hypothetical protein